MTTITIKRTLYTLAFIIGTYLCFVRRDGYGWFLFIGLLLMMAEGDV